MRNTLFFHNVKLWHYAPILKTKGTIQQTVKRKKNLNCMKMSIFDETNISYIKHLDIVTGKKLQGLK